MLNDFLKLIKVFIGFLLVFIFLFITIIALIGLICVSVDYANYKLDESECRAYVENKIVYEGRCHFITIKSIGENGNTKHLTIYKDVLGLKPLKHYVNNDIKIKEVNNANN